jgi:hypothetical protein
MTHTCNLSSQEAKAEDHDPGQPSYIVRPCLKITMRKGKKR